mgnify:CR=1 FL=1
MNNDLKDVSYVDRFEDIKILQYTFDEFNNLPLNKKILIYYLSQASIAGRDIIYDQNYKHNLLIRKALETLFDSFKGDCDSKEFRFFSNYLKRIWFSNGIHDPFSKEKIQPKFSKEFLHQLIENHFEKGLSVYFASASEATEQLTRLIFDPEVAPKGVEQDTSKDIIQHSSVNFYEGVNQEECEAFYNKRQQEYPELSCGLNSKLTRKNNKLFEEIWKAGGMYSDAIQQIIYWLKKALEHAENEQQEKWLNMLIRYYETGNLEEFNNYNIAWLQDTESQADLINGFIETYSDPLGLKGTWESILHVKDT